MTEGGDGRLWTLDDAFGCISVRRKFSTRREFIAFTATASAVAGMAWRPRARASAGNLRPVADLATGEHLLRLPPGFSYTSHDWRGDPTADGNRVPGAHDGMGAFLQPDERTVVLVRNHEIVHGPPIGDAAVYDRRGGGGTTSLSFDLAKREWLQTRVSLAGTAKNCAGGPTPWRSWLTCEEFVADSGADGAERPHGFVFEVPATGVGDTRPLTGLGRFKHEAAAVDPKTAIVYLTEDETACGLYRFVPIGGDTSHGSLRRPGRLQMLAIDGRPNFTGRWPVGLRLPTAWVDIDDPEAHRVPVFRQGYARGGMRFKRLEGCWWDAGRVYFVSTTGGRAGRGQVWELDTNDDRLLLLCESPGREVLDSPDNIVMMTNGALMLCEDGDSPTRLSMLTPAGPIVVVAENNIVLHGAKGVSGDYRGGEWCGVCQVGDWVFANLQSPGMTLAITGPWDDLMAGRT